MCDLETLRSDTNDQQTNETGYQLKTLFPVRFLVRDVFENANHPIFPNNCIYYYIDTESPSTTYNEYKTLYENLGYIDNLLYFGSKDKPQKIKYTILHSRS